MEAVDGGDLGELVGAQPVRRRPEQRTRRPRTAGGDARLLPRCRRSAMDLHRHVLLRSGRADRRGRPHLSSPCRSSSGQDAAPAGASSLVPAGHLIQCGHHCSRDLRRFRPRRGLTGQPYAAVEMQVYGAVAVGARRPGLLQLRRLRDPLAAGLGAGRLLGEACGRLLPTVDRAGPDAPSQGDRRGGLRGRHAGPGSRSWRTRAGTSSTTSPCSTRTEPVRGPRPSRGVQGLVRERRRPARPPETSTVSTPSRGRRSLRGSTTHSHDRRAGRASRTALVFTSGGPVSLGGVERAGGGRWIRTAVRR